MACGAGEARQDYELLSQHPRLRWYKLKKHFSEPCLGGRPESSDASSVLTRQSRTQILPLVFRL